MLKLYKNNLTIKDLREMTLNLRGKLSPEQRLRFAHLWTNPLTKSKFNNICRELGQLISDECRVSHGSFMNHRLADDMLKMSNAYTLYFEMDKLESEDPDVALYPYSCPPKLSVV